MEEKTVDMNDMESYLMDYDKIGRLKQPLHSLNSHKIPNKLFQRKLQYPQMIHGSISIHFLGCHIHQIKNMYEMLVLLDDYGFMEYCIKAYQGKNTDISNDDNGRNSCRFFVMRSINAIG